MIGDNIKKIRKNKHMSQKDFAELLKIPVSTLANYENNHREPNIETLNKIANALNVSFNDIIIDYSDINTNNLKKKISNALYSDVSNMVGVELEYMQEYDLKMNSLYEKYFYDLFFWKTSSMDNKAFFKFILSLSTNDNIALLNDEDITELAVLFSRLLSLKNSERAIINDTNNVIENYSDIVKNNFLTSFNESANNKEK